MTDNWWVTYGFAGGTSTVDTFIVFGFDVGLLAITKVTN